ncbi:Protein PHOTOPERIOD-INDEPENDENT EARLY FLOWERING 1 [Labeo rohita]|uniref:Protein PHOTOPERIOD-INDEPENDENT EARLY FLOWERING 1 n=1 Tax=Labeo rohita TaxID=84645 RepID=A0ABQ8LM15_LABRO|nr:Protein PHOTOPERIOD-INDEPENDENT EARLY FLOWERING 1 [Labeo rohita]
MDDPAVLVLLLEQGDRSLEDHTTDFVFLTNYTHYPDNCLCSFYFAGLNTTTRAQLSGDGPRESFAAYVEWVLVSCNSSLTMDFADDDTSPTLDPEPSQPSPQFAEHEPEPTVDREPEPSVTEELSPKGAKELRITPEPEPVMSDQVREPATIHAREEVTVECKDANVGPAHCTSAEGEQYLDLGLIFLEQDLINFSEDVYEDMPALLPPSKLPDNLEQDLTNFFEDLYEDMPALLPPSELPDNLEQDLINFSEDVYEDMPALLPASKLPDCLDFPPTLPLSIVSAASVPPPLSPGSPSAHPQPTISAVGSLQVCQSPSVSWLEDPSSPPPASESQTPPRSSTQRLHPGSQLPHLHRRPLAHQLHRAPSFLRLHLGRSLSRLRLRTLLLRLCLVAPSHWLCWAPPSLQLHLCPRLLLFRCGPPELRLCLGRQSLGLRLDPPDPRSRPELSALRLHLRLHLHLLRHHQSLASGSLLSSPWLLPLSSPPWTLFIVLLPEVRPPPEPPPTMTLFPLPFHAARSRLPGGGSNVRDLCAIWTVYVCFSRCAHIWFFLSSFCPD